MRRICLKYTIFLGRESRDTIRTPAGLSSGRQSHLWRLGSEMVSKRERKRDLASLLHDRKKGTKGSWINQGLGPRPGGSWHTQRGARKSMGLWPNQKWASQTNPNTALSHPLLEADQALLLLGLHQLCGWWILSSMRSGGAQYGGLFAYPQNYLHRTRKY